MSYVKLDENHQKEADESYRLESDLLEYFDSVRESFDNNEAKRWAAIARTDIEKGLMAFRKAITLQMKSE